MLLSKCRIVIALLLMLSVSGLALSPAPAYLHVQGSEIIPVKASATASSASFPIDPSGSWNPNVQCSTPWIVRITDITNNSTETTSYNTSPFSPGITENPFVTGSWGAKRWLTPGPNPPPTSGWHSPGPACTFTNLQGQTVAAFVEIRGVKTNYAAYVDCNTNYDAVNGGGPMPPGHWCDQDFVIYDPAGIPNYSTYKTSCTTSTDPTCYYRMGSEFDHDWAARGFVGPSTSWANNSTMKQDFLSNSETLFDVQGFVYWDPDHVTAQGHSFSGWELHPFTAWRLSSSLSASFTYTPGSPAGQPVTFTASASGGSAVYSYTWSFGDGSSATGNPVMHTFSTAGSYTVILTVNDSANHSISIQQTVNVSSQTVPDFTIKAGPASATVLAGGTVSSTVTVTSVNGFSSTVTLSDSISPATGLSCSLNPNSVQLGSSASSQLQCNGSAGVYSVTVTGTSGSLAHSTSFSVTVQDFSVTGNPSSVSLANGAATSAITLTSINGLAGTVALSSTITPNTSNSPTATLTSTSLMLSSGGSTTTILTITASSTTSPGSYTATVTGSSGGLSHTVIIGITVNQPDFSITADSSTLRVLAGSPGSATITASSLGDFSGTVLLTLATTSGLAASLNPTSLTLISAGSASSTLTTSSAALGNYTITITGTSGSVVHSISVLVIVSDFSIGANPSSLRLSRSSMTSSTITVTGLNGFSGIVTLMESTSISSLKVSLSSTSLTLTQGSATATLNIRALRKAPLGAYTLTITATIGGVSHSVTLTITITA